MLDAIKSKIREHFPEKGTVGYALKHGNRATRRQAMAQVKRLERKQHKQFQRQLNQKP